jgi:hypothetical protein
VVAAHADSLARIDVDDAGARATIDTPAFDSRSDFIFGATSAHRRAVKEVESSLVF